MDHGFGKAAGANVAGLEKLCRFCPCTNPSRRCRVGSAKICMIMGGLPPSAAILLQYARVAPGNNAPGGR
jgi:hypothetical protein